MSAPSNEARELHELLVELKLPVRAVVTYGLGVTNSAFYSWRDKSVLIPPDRRAQMRDLIDTLKYHMEAGTLPIGKDELLWLGLVALTERKG